MQRSTDWRKMGRTVSLAAHVGMLRSLARERGSKTAAESFASRQVCKRLRSRCESTSIASEYCAPRRSGGKGICDGPACKVHATSATHTSGWAFKCSTRLSVAFSSLAPSGRTIRANCAGRAESPEVLRGRLFKNDVAFVPPTPNG